MTNVPHTIQDPEKRAEYKRFMRDLKYEHLDRIELLAPSLEAVNAAEQTRTAQRQAEHAAEQQRTSALVEALRNEHADLVAVVEQAQQAADAASYAAADAYADLDAHNARKPSNPKDVARWAARRSELQEVHSAYEDVAAARMTEHEQAVARLTAAIDGSMRQRQEQATQACSEAVYAAKRMREHADTLETEARQHRFHVLKFRDRIRQEGINTLFIGEEE